MVRVQSQPTLKTIERIGKTVLPEIILTAWAIRNQKNTIAAQ